tara:strand:- start:437 stop:706 length:270 start_codon:yes stop_codon:yes gene_type:complete
MNPAILNEILSGNTDGYPRIAESAEIDENTLALKFTDGSYCSLLVGELDEPEMLFDKECLHQNAVLSDPNTPETWHCPDCGENVIIPEN